MRGRSGGVSQYVLAKGGLRSNQWDGAFILPELPSQGKQKLSLECCALGNQDSPLGAATWGKD